MSGSRRSSMAVLSLCLLGGEAVMAGCSANIEGAPYGEAEPLARSGRKRGSEGITSSAPVPDAKGETSAPIVVADAGVTADAGTAAVADASSATTPPTCAPTKGVACEECCFGKVPGGPAAMSAMDGVWADCVSFERCNGNLACEDFCAGVAWNEVCRAQTSVCDQIDACIVRSACY